MSQQQNLPRFVGDSSRRITVELPPTFEDLEHLCLTSFGMVGPVTLYKNGVASLTPEDYNSIQSGENFVVVDSRGNAMNMKDFFVSTYDDDFTEKPLPPRGPPAQAQPWNKTPDDRNFRTTEDDYQAWPLENRQQPVAAQQPQTLPFRGTTEHREEYTPHKIPPREAGPPPRDYRKTPDGRNFAPESSKYQAWELPQREQPPPAQRHQPLPFQAKSAYQDDYVAHDLPSRPVPQKQQWTPSAVPFNAETTARADYRQWDLPRRDVPHQVARPPPSLPFNTRSTTQDDYRAHQLPERSAPPESVPYRKMPDNRDFSPESSKYRAWDLPKREQPTSMQRPDPLPFQAKSSYQEDYVPYAVEARREPVPPHKLPPKIPFNARTVTQDDYQAYPAQKKVYITLEPMRT